MAQATIVLSSNNGTVRTKTDLDGHPLERSTSAEELALIQQEVLQLLASFESGCRPFADPVILAELGRRLRDDLLPAGFVPAIQEATRAGNTRLLFSSLDPMLLNLPWELLPGPDGQFLVNDARCSIRRTMCETLPPSSAALVPRRCVSSSQLARPPT